MAIEFVWMVCPGLRIDAQVMMGLPKKAKDLTDPLSEVRPQLQTNQMIEGVHE